MYLSIITTLYYSAPYLQEFYERISAEAQKITDDYEIIFVNDGSPDNSLELVVELHQQDPKVKVIDLSRNFGHVKAMMTGVAHTQGELVFIIDCDLEEEPELLGQFYQTFTTTDFDVVYGVQKNRKGKLFEKLSGRIFYQVFNLLSNVSVEPNLLTIRLMSRRYVEALLKYSERETYLPGIWALAGFKQLPFAIKKHSKGTSTYTLSRKVAMMVNSITSFSNKPLVFVFYLGIFVSLIGLLGSIQLIIQKIFFNGLLAGWSSLIVSIWLIGGLNIFCLGVIGIYISKIFLETKQRPHAIIRQIYDRDHLPLSNRKQENLSEEYQSIN